MNEVKIITELCAEDRARIDKHTAALEALTAALGNVGTPFQTEPKKSTHITIIPNERGMSLVGKVLDEPLYEEGTGVNDLGFIPIETDEDDEPEAPQCVYSHTKEELQQKVVGLVSKGKKEEVKDIIKGYAAKVSEIPEDKVDEVWAKLDALEG